MPRKSATDKKAEVKANLEEIPPSETSEIKSEVSTSEVIENPMEATSKKRFGYKWIFVILALILIFLFLVFFKNISDFFTEDISRFYVAGGVFTTLIIFLLVWFVPKQQVKALKEIPLEAGEKKFEREEKRLKLEDDKRKTLAQIIGGVFLILGLFVTYNTYRLGLQKQDLDRRGQMTERFNKAVEHLGNQDLAVRLGGLYALEQILNDSPEDHRTIIEVLSAYIREKAKKNVTDQKISNQTNLSIEKDAKILTDVQTALTIIVSRPAGGNRIERVINVSGTNLIGVNLSPSIQMDIVGNLRTFSDDVGIAPYTNLQFFDFRYADLRFANLRQTELRGTYLWEADINYADLSGVQGLTVGQLEQARFDYIRLDGSPVNRESALKFFKEKEDKKIKEYIQVYP